MPGFSGVTRLDELDRIEWWDVCRKVRPDLTEDEFEAQWAEFQRAKARRALNG